MRTQGRRSIFDIGGYDLVARQHQLRACEHRGVSERDVPPQKWENFFIFATGIMQFGEYF